MKRLINTEPITSGKFTDRYVSINHYLSSLPDRISKVPSKLEIIADWSHIAGHYSNIHQYIFTTFFLLSPAYYRPIQISVKPWNSGHNHKNISNSFKGVRYVDPLQFEKKCMKVMVCW